jgi:hypothetical protein
MSEGKITPTRQERRIIISRTTASFVEARTPANCPDILNNESRNRLKFIDYFTTFI